MVVSHDGREYGNGWWLYNYVSVGLVSGNWRSRWYFMQTEPLWVESSGGLNPATYMSSPGAMVIRLPENFRPPVNGDLKKKSICIKLGDVA